MGAKAKRSNRKRKRSKKNRQTLKFALVFAQCEHNLKAFFAKAMFDAWTMIDSLSSPRFSGKKHQIKTRKGSQSHALRVNTPCQCNHLFGACSHQAKVGAKAKKFKEEAKKIRE